MTARAISAKSRSSPKNGAAPGFRTSPLPSQHGFPGAPFAKHLKPAGLSAGSPLARAQRGAPSTGPNTGAERAPP
eukprot:9247307-Alexandrium_andersonii.AAC.1